MARLGTGSATPEKRKARAGTLSLREPHIESLVAGLATENVNELRRFCKMLTRERNRWDIERRRSGIFGSRRILKTDANKALKAALSALEGGE